MRGAERVALAALCLAACSVDATGVRVTLITGGATLDRLDVTVLLDQREIGHGDYRGPIADGATFGVVLADALAGAGVTIAITGSLAEVPVCSARDSVTVEPRRAVPLTLTLDCGALGDMAAPDDGGDDACCAPADLTPDPAPDLTSLDLTPGPDLTPHCDPSCDGGIATICAGGRQEVACSFQCDGDRGHCWGPPSCSRTVDVSKPGDYFASSVGAEHTTTGSCQQMAGGPDNSYRFTTGGVWANATLSLAARFPASLFARASCSFDELTLGGRCANAMVAPACASGRAVKYTLCGLPPGAAYWAFVAELDPAGTGGDYALSTSFQTVDLNDCANAGMLPLPKYTVTGDTRGKANRLSAPLGVAGCGDRGVNSPEQVYWMPVPSPGKTLTVTVTGDGGFQPLLYLDPGCADQARTTVCEEAQGGVARRVLQPAPGAWYIVVDGQSRAEGRFTLDVSLN